MSGFCSLLFFLFFAIALPCSKCIPADCASPAATMPGWIERTGNNVTLNHSNCGGTLYFSTSSSLVCNELGSNETTTRTNFIVNQSTEGFYICGTSISCPPTPILEIPQVTTYTSDYVEWGQEAIINCGFRNGLYSEITWNVFGNIYTIGRPNAIEWIRNNGSDSNLRIPSFNPLFGGTYICRANIRGLCNDLYIISNRTVSVKKSESITDTFVEDLSHQVMRPDNNNTAQFSCSANVSSSDTFIAFEMFGSKQSFNIDSDTCCNSRGDDCLTGSTYSCSSRTVGNVNISGTCNYSTPYHIKCTFNLTAPPQRNISTVACHIMNSTTDSTLTTTNRAGLIIRDNNRLGAPVASNNNNETITLDIEFPFSLPTRFKDHGDFHKLEIMMKQGDSSSPMTINTNDIVTFNIMPGNTMVQVVINVNDSGIYTFSYKVSFFGEEDDISDESNSTLFIIQVLPSSTVSTSSIPTLSSTPDGSPVTTTDTPTNILPIIAAASSVGVLIIFSVVLLTSLICCGCFLKRKKVHQSHNLQTLSPARHTSNTEKYTMEMSTADLHESPYNPATTSKLHPQQNPSMNGDSFNHSAMSLINSEHPSHICNCSCHTVSSHSHSSGPSHSSAASYARLNVELPRYGHPDAEYNPPQHCNRHRTQELRRQEEITDGGGRQRPPNSLGISSERADIPSLKVVLPTPVMINQPAVLSPTDSNDTEPFGSEPNTPGVSLDSTDGHTKRPNKLNIRKEKESITDDIQLAVMLFLQHTDCNDREHCQCCKMITKQFEKISQELGKDTLDRAIKDIQTPGTEGHRQLLRRKGRTPARSPRVGFLLGAEKRNRSNSTSQVHDNELTFSSTETEEEDSKNVRRLNYRRTNSRKAYTDDELERDTVFLPISAIPKEVVRSEPDLATPTPVDLPPSLIYQGATPTNPFPNNTKQDSLPFSDDSGSTDDSSTSSRPSSNSRLDNINPLDNTCTSLLAAPTNSQGIKKYNSLSSGYMSSTDNETQTTTRNVNGVNGNTLQPLTDTEYSDSDSYSSPAHLLPKSQLKNNSRSHGPSLAKKHPVQYPPSMTSATTRRSPSPSISSHKSNSPSHSRPITTQQQPHNVTSSLLSTSPGNYHYMSSHRHDTGSIHSSQSARGLLDNSDQSSSGSTHSIHSDGYTYPQNGGYHHHQRNHQRNPYRVPPNPQMMRGSNNSSLHGSAIRLPQSDSMATPL